MIKKVKASFSSNNERDKAYVAHAEANLEAVKMAGLGKLSVEDIKWL